jgi:hypothetical protein
MNIGKSDDILRGFLQCLKWKIKGSGMVLAAKK